MQDNALWRIRRQAEVAEEYRKSLIQRPPTLGEIFFLGSLGVALGALAVWLLS